jgi:hypothetical protein
MIDSEGCDVEVISADRSPALVGNGLVGRRDLGPEVTRNPLGKAQANGLKVIVGNVERRQTKSA